MNNLDKNTIDCLLSGHTLSKNGIRDRVSDKTHKILSIRN